jgi:hypothetical protein
MPSAKKPPSDPSVARKSILDHVTGEAAMAAETDRLRPRFKQAINEARGVTSGEKNPAAVELGRKGGQARATALSADDRKRIAEDAARKRWGDRKPLDDVE